MVFLGFSWGFQGFSLGFLGFSRFSLGCIVFCFFHGGFSKLCLILRVFWVLFLLKDFQVTF